MERKDGSKTEKNKEGGGITMALLEVKNLGISFGGLRAVNAFDIEKFSQRNRDKCLNCIYEPACDRSLI